MGSIQGRKVDGEKGEEIPGKLKKPIALGVSSPLLSVLPTTVIGISLYMKWCLWVLAIRYFKIPIFPSPHS